MLTDTATSTCSNSQSQAAENWCAEIILSVTQHLTPQCGKLFPNIAQAQAETAQH